MNESIIPVLQRLARGSDDRATALSVILLLRSLRAECADGASVEVSRRGDGVLVQIDDLARSVPVSMRRLQEVLDEMPELVGDLERTDATLRVRLTHLVAATSRATLPGEV